ncbi:hypothetical protein PCC7424_1104 [Gloeothece citriformis PCC 7424]|uniref:Uncharacterized protein n=1 Tax=Gloeothece citriformis (strain PCC 7424) TaxID=65393 RepID=B7KJV6_GLOC7|nr:hypothetical protein PCC7424_1104 [Gloeothece citriformis PCC 7424]
MRPRRIKDHILIFQKWYYLADERKKLPALSLR